MSSIYTRREFIQSSSCLSCALAIGSTSLLSNQAFGITKPSITKDLSNEEARYYEKQENLKILCKLCPKECLVADKERGYCGVRENQGGTYRSLVYGRPCSLNIDPIEKKPLFHYLPGSRAFSLATAGCNIECKFCQNWNISQFRPEQIRMYDLSPSATAQLAHETKCQTIAYTYSEPVIFTEYMHDTAKEARTKKVGSVMISNGYIQEKPLRDVLKQLTAVKIDFKGFTEKFYKESCNGELQPVLDTLKIIKQEGTWLELVILIIPTLNDSIQENQDMAKWIVDNLGPDVPIHLTRFHPMYKITTISSTPVSKLEKLQEIMKKAGMHYVYLGNVAGHPSENTYCHSCNQLLIRRLGYQTVIEGLKDGKCKKCETSIPGVWTDPLS
jgi:pyruvate formate lyase activating enzyme